MNIRSCTAICIPGQAVDRSDRPFFFRFHPDENFQSGGMIFFLKNPGGMMEAMEKQERIRSHSH
jgi:hypothetical protein